MSAFEVLALNTSIPQIQAAQAGDSYVMVVNATTPALRITQTGTGDSILVEDAANPDSSPFVVTAAGDVGIGTSSPSTYNAKLVSYGSFGTSTPAFSLVNASAENASNIAESQYWLSNSFSGLVNVAKIGAISGATGNQYGSLYFSTSNAGAPTERMRLDSSGNLGLGVTPSAWYGSFGTKAFQFAASGSIYGLDVSSSDRRAGLMNNAFINSSGNYTYINTGAATQYEQNAGKHLFLNAPSGTANTTTITNGVSYIIITSGNQTAFGAANNNVGTAFTATSSGTLSSGTVSQNISFTQAMTLDASGNLVVGATSALKFNTTGSASTRLSTLYSTGTISATRAEFQIGSEATASGAIAGLIMFGCGASTTTSNALANVFAEVTSSSTSVAYGALGFATANGSLTIERARITSDGYFKASDNGTYGGSGVIFHEFNQTAAAQGVLTLYGKNASTTAAGMLYIETARNTTNNTYYAISYYNTGAAAYKFRVADSGDVTNTNGTYGTISDQKMKTDIVDAGSQWSDIKALRFRKFKMKDDPSGRVQLGVVAQEVELTSPGLVDEHQDRDAEGNDLGTTTKSVKTSVLLMKAAVALQEAMARIETLEAKIAALEAK